MDEEYRCRRGDKCGAREALQDPVTGGYLGWAGARLTGQDVPLPRMRGQDLGGQDGIGRDRDPVPGSFTGLCPGCVIAVDQALIGVRLDVVELTTCLPGRLNGSSMETGTITRFDPGPRTPLQEHLHALRALIDHEVCTAAAHVAEAIGEPWSRDTEQRSRIGARVETATTLLRFRLGWFLALPPIRYRARSLTSRRADGHDLDACRVVGDDIWDTTRDGVDRALVLHKLHGSAWYAGGHSQAPDHLGLPCRNRACCAKTLLHWPGEDDVVCTTCGAVIPWADYDELRSILTGSINAA